MFTLYTGPFERLEDALVHDLREARKQDPWSSLLVVSPSGHQLTRLQFEYTRRYSVLINTHFLSFYSLAERLMTDSDYTEPIVTEPAFFSEMIHQVLVGPSPEPVDLSIRQAFGVTGSTLPRGLANALAATLKDLRDSGIRADDALRAAQQGYLGPEAPEAAATLALHARLVGLLERKGLRTSADLLRRAARRASDHPWLRVQARVLLYGFYDLTGAQLDFVTALSAHPRASIYCPFEKASSDFAYAEQFLNDPALAGKVKSHVVLEGTSIPRPAVDVISVSGQHNEAWWTAKEILRLADEGVPFHDMAILARQITPYLSVLRDVLSANRIPYKATRGPNAGAHPFLKTLRLLVRTEEDQARALLRLEELRASPYIEADNLSERLAASGDLPRSWASHIAQTLADIHAVLKWPPRETTEETALWRQIEVSLERLTVLDRLDQPVTRKHFLEVWEEHLNRLERPTAGLAASGVQVLDVQQARGLSFRYVFLLGMNEKVFPRLIREDPFLSDAARHALAQATGSRLGKKLDGYMEERLLFTLTKQAARSRCYLIAQRSDDEGRARMASAYWREQEALSINNTHRLPRGLLSKLQTQTPMVWSPKELSYAINRERADPTPVYRALRWDVQRFERLLSAHHRVERFAPGLQPFDGLISNSEAIQKILKKGFSPSSLEEIAECPYQFFSSHLLSIAPAENPAPRGEITATAMGKLFHRALELFYTNVGAQTSAIETLELGPALEAAVEQCFAEQREPLGHVYPLALRATRTFIRTHLLTFLKRDLEEAEASGYRPRWFEQSLAGAIPELSGRWTFQGKADRIDRRERHGQVELRVVDYKSGKPKTDPSRVDTQLIQGKLLQLPIYLGLARAFGRSQPDGAADAVQALFRPIRASEGMEAIPREVLSHFWTSPAAPMVKETVEQLTAIIEHGRFFIEPDTGPNGHCRRCDFARICRKEHMPTRFRSEHDPIRLTTRQLLSRTAPKDKPISRKPVARA